MVSVGLAGFFCSGPECSRVFYFLLFLFFVQCERLICMVLGAFNQVESRSSLASKSL